MPNRIPRFATLLVLPVVVVLSACGKSGPARKEVFPVTGQLVVDGGQPGSPIRIECHDVNGIDQQAPTFSWCQTADDGTFSLSTYENGDGVPVGKYALTFQWGTMNLVSMNYSGDKFDKRYADPKSSPVRFEVEKGKPTSLGAIALTTKKGG